MKSSKPTVFLNLHRCENKRKRTFSKIPPLSSVILYEQKWKENDGKNLTATENPPDIGFEKLPNTVLTHIKYDNAWSEIEFQGMCGSKHTLVIP